jgi:hypothetical protein
MQQHSPEREKTLEEEDKEEEEEHEEGNSYQEVANTDDSRYVLVVFPYQNKANFCK